MASCSLDSSRIMAQLSRDGWRLEYTSGGHVKCFSPCGKFIVLASKSVEHRSDWRAIRNFLARLKKAGWTPRT